MLGVNLCLYPPHTPLLISYLHSLEQGYQIVGRAPPPQYTGEEWSKRPEAAREMVLQAGPEPSAGFSLLCHRRTKCALLLNLKHVNGHIPFLPHQSPGKWWGSRVGGDFGVGYVIEKEEIKPSDRVTWK